jgi:uncharacterized protein (PEP-CTERM system associated)
MAPCADAAEWKISPGITLRETYTDNVDLVPQETAQSDFVTEIAPEIFVTGIGQHIDFKAYYLMQNLYYAKTNNRRTVNTLNADGKVEVVDDLFFVDGKAGASQQSISAFGPQSIDNINITGNRTEVRNYSISPYLRHRLDSTAVSELRFTRASLQTDTSDIANAKANQIRLRLLSGPAFRDLAWAMQYIDQRITFSNDSEFNLKKISGGARYLISPTFGLTATVGHERYSYISLGEKPDGYFWSGGFAWAPSERTIVQASGGKRFYGGTFSAEANHRTRNTVWNVSYNEDLTTTQSQYLFPAGVETSSFLDQLLTSSIPDPAVRQQAVDNFVRNADLPSTLSTEVNAFSDRVFLQKRARASVALTGARNTVVFNVFNIRRDPQSAPLFVGPSLAGIDDATRQTGAYVLWSSRVTARTNANISTEYTRTTSLSTSRRDDNKTVRLAVITQFQPKLSGRLEFRRVHHDSNQAGGSFRENAIAASVFASF